MHWCDINLYMIAFWKPFVSRLGTTGLMAGSKLFDTLMVYLKCLIFCSISILVVADCKGLHFKF